MTVFLHHSKDGKVSHLQCDDHVHRTFHTFDEEPRDVERQEPGAGDDDRDDEDQALARCVADAVCDAIKSFRKGDKRSARDEELEKRERNLDARERARDAGLGESRAQSTQSLDRARRGGRDEELDHRRDWNAPGGRRPPQDPSTADGKRGMAQDRARAIGETIHGQDKSAFTHRTVDLESIFPAHHPHANAEGASADVDAIFGGGSRH